MNLKAKLEHWYEAVDAKFEQQFSFRIKETSFAKINHYLHEPKDASSLAVARIFFGLLMLFDIPDERGGSTMERRWGNPETCHFPLLPFLLPLPMPYMAIIYAALWIGALGIMVGYKFRFNAIMFTICYWYLFLIEKSFWNNHSYLFGLIALLLACSQANCYWSLDAYLNPKTFKETVPYWNYFLLKYQFFILYFVAGLKKSTAEWLSGYSVPRLSKHWVFNPLKILLSGDQIDFIVVHWFTFVFDLTITLWMMWDQSRNLSMIFCAAFHLMNSRLFRIGMFPWVCLATMPLYYPFDWPKTFTNYVRAKYLEYETKISEKFTAIQLNYLMFIEQREHVEQEGDYGNSDDEDSNSQDNNTANDDEGIADNDLQLDTDQTETAENEHDKNNKNKATDENTNEKQDSESVDEKNNDKTDLNIKCKSFCDVDKRKKLTTCLVIIYMMMQAFLPYSHFITKGYNNWTKGLYGYSWDMMVHTWDTQSVVIKFVDNKTQNDYYIDPTLYALNDRWTRHGDMVYQYAHCLKDNLIPKIEKNKDSRLSVNFSIHIDVWCSMNGRYTQRLFDPKVNMLQAKWSPFEPVLYLMPLLDEALHWRSTLEKMTREIQAWYRNSDVVFLAEFPGYDLEKYIPQELRNISLTVLEGTVLYEPQITNLKNGQSYKLTTGHRIEVIPGFFHKITNIGQTPAYYMYTFRNISDNDLNYEKEHFPELDLFKELFGKFNNMFVFADVVGKSIYKIIYGCDEC